MKNYFTTIEKIEGSFFGTVTDNDNQQVVFKTIAKPDHASTIIDVNNYLQNQSTEDINRHVDSIPQTITNTTTYTPPVAQPEPRRCCGR
jgi:hypothetical protein